MAAGTSRRSFAIARKIYLRGNLAYRDSHAAVRGWGREEWGDWPLLGRRLF